MVAHTHRLLQPQLQSWDGWVSLDELRSTLVDVVAEAGRHYLPWVASATVDGAAAVEFADGVTVDIESTPFLDAARGVMLARYLDARSPELDEVLDAAGVLQYFADHVDQATAIPETIGGAQPAQNRPYAVN